MLSSSSTATRLVSLSRSFSTCSSPLRVPASSSSSPPPSLSGRKVTTEMGQVAAQLKEQLEKGKVVEKEYHLLTTRGIPPPSPPPRPLRPLGIKREEIANMPESLKVMGYPNILATLPITPLARALLTTLPDSSDEPPRPHYTRPTTATHLPVERNPSTAKYDPSTPKAVDAPYVPGTNKILSSTLVMGRNGEVVNIGERGKYLKPTKADRRERNLELVRELKGLTERNGLDKKGRGDFEWLTEEEEFARREREMEGIF